MSKVSIGQEDEMKTTMQPHHHYTDDKNAQNSIARANA